MAEVGGRAQQPRRKLGEEQGRDATKFLPLSDAAKEAAIHVGVRLGQVRHPTVYAAPRMSVNIAPKATGEDTRPTSTCEPDVLERIIAEARRLARIEGADAVRPRDIERAAAKAGGGRGPGASPADDQPTHHDEVVDALALLRHRVLGLSGGRVPRVLVVGETAGENGEPPTVAKAFRDAGADVATCDLKPSNFEGIPHFQGDAIFIQDLGWDLVVAHPPCTYLANSGVGWLYKESDRWEHMLRAATTGVSSRAFPR